MNFTLRLLSWLSLALLIGADDSVDDSGHYYNKFSVCDDSSIVVEDIQVLCDSPGTYYYGSGRYRNSASCQAGDKAKLSIMFYINQDLEELYSNVYMDLSVSGYGTVAGKDLYQKADICEIDSLKSSSSDVSCPGKGYYQLYYIFHWGSQADDYEYSFIPKVTIGFTSNPSKGVYDLGGANTNYCSGDTFIGWTKGVRKSAANTIKTFFATFGILLCAVLAVFCSGWLIMRQSRNQPKEVIVEDPLDENEKHKVALMGDSKNSLLNIP